MSRTYFSTVFVFLKTSPNPQREQHFHLKAGSSKMRATRKTRAAAFPPPVLAPPSVAAPCSLSATCWRGVFSHLWAHWGHPRTAKLTPRVPCRPHRHHNAYKTKRKTTNSKSAPGPPPGRPRGAQGPPRGAKVEKSAPTDAPRVPQGPPRGRPRVPRDAQGTPKDLPKSPQGAPGSPRAPRRRPRADEDPKLTPK